MTNLCFQESHLLPRDNQHKWENRKTQIRGTQKSMEGRLEMHTHVGDIPRFQGICSPERGLIE